VERDGGDFEPEAGHHEDHRQQEQRPVDRHRVGERGRDSRGELVDPVSPYRSDIP